MGHDGALSHSSSFDHRRRPATFRTAMATAFFCPTSTTSRLPRVTPGVEEVPPQHRVVLGQHRDDHGRILRALALVHGRGVGGHQRVELAQAVDVLAPVEPRGQLPGFGVDVGDLTDVAVVDLLVVVVLDLHHLVARREGPAEALDLALAGRVEGGLQLDVQRAGAGAAPVHRAQHLDVVDGIETEALRDPRRAPDRRSARRRSPAPRPARSRSRCRRPAGPDPGMTPRLIPCALVTIRLRAAWRKTSVSRTTGTAPGGDDVGQHLARPHRRATDRRRPR